jgi:hypothetical protein
MKWIRPAIMQLKSTQISQAQREAFRLLLDVIENHREMREKTSARPSINYVKRRGGEALGDPRKYRELIIFHKCSNASHRPDECEGKVTGADVVFG